MVSYFAMYFSTNVYLQICTNFCINDEKYKQPAVLSFQEEKKIFYEIFSKCFRCFKIFFCNFLLIFVIFLFEIFVVLVK